MEAPKLIQLREPNTDEELASLLSETLTQYFAKQTLLIRCIGSQDHSTKTKPELIQHVLKTGTDKYDDAKQVVGHDFYKKWNPDFFALPVKVTETTNIFDEILTDFKHGAIEDRGYSVSVDLVLLYDPEQCEMITDVYEGQSESDLFIFKNPEQKQQALRAVIDIQSDES